jgi:hypothetical protein
MMANKEVVFALLGHPVVEIEITDTQYNAIVVRVQGILAACGLTPTNSRYTWYEEEGVLAHCKYLIGRIRAKYERMVERPEVVNSQNVKQLWHTMDGHDLVVEGWDHIKLWYKMLG